MSFFFHVSYVGSKVKFMDGVDALFWPNNVVLIGSSEIREEVGMTSPQLFRSVIHNMRKHFTGKSLVIDLNGKTGRKDLDGLLTIPDLAIIMLPSSYSVEQIKRCAEAGIKSVIVITGGFNNEERRQLLKVREDFGVRILGPNTIMGVINTSNGLNTTFERDLMPKKGNISVVSQSGGVGAYMLDWSCFHNVGINKFVFIGDKIDIDDVDLLQYYANDKDTKVICLYMEGLKNGRVFIEEAKKIVEKKPILVLKSGRTEESAKRAKSHTASIAGSDEIFDAAFKKARVMRCEDIEELMNAAIALSKQPPMHGDNVAIISNVGGPAILAADSIVRNNLKLAVISEETQNKIKSLYPNLDVTNPLDIIADARAERYEKILHLILADRNVNGILVINMLKSSFFKPEDARVIEKVAAQYPGKPVVDVPAGGEDFSLVHEILGYTNIPLYDLPEKAARAMKFLRDYGKILEKQ